MTLVISNIFANELFIESDSKVTDPKTVFSDRFCSVLKTAIIHPSISVSYAGTIAVAEAALEECLELAKKSPINWQDVVNILSRAHVTNNCQTEFLVGLICDDGPRHIRIRNGNHEIRSDGQLWIGDIVGFKLFQEIRHKHLQTGMAEKQALQLAFKSVIENPNIPSIDHFHISVRIGKVHGVRDGKPFQDLPVFLYSEKIELENPEPQTIHFEKKGEWKNISMGTADGGANGVSYFVSLSPEFHAVAVHFPFENRGILFCPQLGFSGKVFDNIQGELYTDVNGEGFLDLIKNQFGIPMLGFVKLDDSIMYVSTL